METNNNNTMTAAELALFLTNFAGASFVSVETVTEPKMVKHHRVTGEVNPFLNRVTRRATRLGMLGAFYENAVQNQRVREEHPAAMRGERFRAEELWNGAGEHVDNSACLARHRRTGKLYLVLYPRQDGEGTVVVQSSEWRVDGQPVEVSTLRPYLAAVREGTERQETERPIAWRTIALENIVSITVRGETFTIVRP